MVFASSLSAQLTIPTGSSDLRLALKKLAVLGTALYVAAHPDDENTAVISFLANGRHIRTAYLAMTRGEGGQNLIGPEQGALLGILRTQELLSARRIDGGEQYFTRAIDFGYSKTSEETIRIWGRDRIIGDIVWVIRHLRPDVIITRFTDSLGTHGNHTGSAILAREAFHAAGDPNKFPEQLQYVAPWQPKRIVFNIFRFSSSGMDPTPNSVSADVGAYSTFLGESFTELSGRSRSMHKSQGFGAAEHRGQNLQYFEPTAGVPAVSDLFDGIDLGWSRVRGGEEVGKLVEEANQLFDPENPSAIISILLKAYTALGLLAGDPWIAVKQSEIRNVILGCAGVHVEALAEKYSASPGEKVAITVSVLSRSEANISLRSLRLPFSLEDSVMNLRLQNNIPLRVRSAAAISPARPYSQPYWLEADPLPGSYVVGDQKLRGQAEDSPLTVAVSLGVDGVTFVCEVPIRYKWVDRVRGELSRPFVIVPPVAVNVSEPMLVFPGSQEKQIRLTLVSAVKNRGMAKLEVPEGWVVNEPRRSFEFGEGGGEDAVAFNVRPSGLAESGEFRAILEFGGKTSSLGIVNLDYPHIDPQVFFPEAAGRLIRIPMDVRVSTIGYIEGSGDDIPSALQQLGYSVKLLNDADLEFADMRQFDAIVAGVRAYNTRDKLRAHHGRLMEYVRTGGRYIVQYVTRERGKSQNIGPYPFEISRDRVTVEEAPVGFVNPDHPLLNHPNKITQKDFEGWVQERGLYFADSWDPKYEAILTSNDPGESPRQGGLLAAKYGEGTYIYTGYSFFRQLPAGVPGAYRLLVNLISKDK